VTPLPAEQRPAALLFDWDNTLIDSWLAIHHALEVTFQAMGRTPWTLAETKANVRRSAREAFPDLFGARAPEATELFYATFAADHLETLRPIEGADALLRTLAGAGYELAVVSNKTGGFLRAEAEALGWSGLFRALVGATDAARDKPAPDPVEMALAGSRAEAGPRGQVWFVGDTDIDLQCAANAGCTGVLLREVPPGPDEFGALGPHRHVRSCPDLQALLGLG
jgi:phosphoglycolate phosphatase